MVFEISMCKTPNCTRIPYIQGCCLKNLVEIAQGVLEKKKETWKFYTGQKLIRKAAFSSGELVSHTHTPLFSNIDILHINLFLGLQVTLVLLLSYRKIRYLQKVKTMIKIYKLLPTCSVCTFGTWIRFVTAAPDIQCIRVACPSIHTVVWVCTTHSCLKIKQVISLNLFPISKAHGHVDEIYLR